MAKRKNPLKDLDAFLKQEAKSIVEPDKLKETTETTSVSKKDDTPSPSKITKAQVIDFLAREVNNEKEFYTLIQQAIEKNDTSSAKQKMLINTLLFLKDKEHWKDHVREYWS